MGVEITMPKLSQTTEEVLFIRWLVDRGDTIRKGDPICEVENDKTTMEVESFAAGTITNLLAEPDTEIAAGTVIAILDGAAGEPVAPVKSAPAGDKKVAVKQVKATHLVQNIAKKRGIDLSKVRGTGARGLITKKDLEEYEKNPVASESPIAPDQQILGRNLQASKATIPHYYLKSTIHTDRLIGWRNANVLADGSKISINAILLHAISRALESFPKLNSYYHRNSLQVQKDINIGLAVAAGDDLYVPVVKQTNTKDIHSIERELKWLIAKTSNNRLEPEDLQGGTFTVTNLGMFPVDEFTAIINPPQTAILAFGKMQNQVIVDSDASMRIGSVCAATGSFDHRVINGAQAAAFLAAVKSLLEEL